MGLFKVFDIAGSAMSAQSVRLNTTASNLANANTAAGSAEEAYRARQPVFQTVLDDQSMDQRSVGVRVFRGRPEPGGPAKKSTSPDTPMRMRTATCTCQTSTPWTNWST